VTTQVTLTKRYTIKFADHNKYLSYNHIMIFSATCNSGAVPTLSATGAGKDVNWTFDITNNWLTYTVASSVDIIVTITATSPNADTVTTQVTLVKV
jgi:hypothetical protein